MVQLRSRREMNSLPTASTGSCYVGHGIIDQQEILGSHTQLALHAAKHNFLGLRGVEHGRDEHVSKLAADVTEVMRQSVQ